MRFRGGIPDCVPEFYRELEEREYEDYLKERKDMYDDDYQSDLYESDDIGVADDEDEQECEESCGIVDSMKDDFEKMPF